jgi:hypothetical protein
MLHLTFCLHTTHFGIEPSPENASQNDHPSMQRPPEAPARVR